MQVQTPPPPAELFPNYVGISGVVLIGEASVFMDSDPLARKHHLWTISGRPVTVLGEHQLCPGGWALRETVEHPAFAEGWEAAANRTRAPEAACCFVLVIPG